MSDQPESTADDSLPNPTPDETARLMREGTHSKVPAWKRLLPPWVFSIGLHLFVLPFVLGITVIFADSLFVPTVWNDVRDERLGEDPYSNLFIDRDDGIAEEQEKTVPLADVGHRKLKEMPDSPKEPGTEEQAATGTNSPSTAPGTKPLEDMVIEGTVVTAGLGQITIVVPDGTQRTFQIDELTQVFRSGDVRFFALEGGVGAILPKTTVSIMTFVKDGKNLARMVSVGAGGFLVAQPKPPATGTNGNIVIEQPARSIPGGDQEPDVIYVPTPQAVVDKMLEVAKLQPNEILFDLGSGDGRFPITAAKKFGAWGFGYEIDPKLVKESLENANKAGVQNRVVIERRDMFKLDLSKADVVSAYILPSMMVKMIPQFDQMKPGSRIVSHDFDMQGVIPDKAIDFDATDGNGNRRTHKIYLWTIPLKKAKPSPPDGSGAKGGAGGTSGSGSADTKGTVFLSKDEVELVNLINARRAENQLPSFIPTAPLSEITRRWAKAGKAVDLYNGGGFLGPDRFGQAGVGLTASRAFDLWMKSGGFVSSLICDKQFKYIGVSSGEGGGNIPNIYFACLFSNNPAEE